MKTPKMEPELYVCSACGEYVRIVEDKNGCFLVDAEPHDCRYDPAKHHLHNERCLNQTVTLVGRA